MERTAFSCNRWFVGTDLSYMGLAAANNVADEGRQQ
jgi:hypothetical protein